MLSKPSQAGRYYRAPWLPKKEADANAEVITYTLTPDERAELDAKLLKKYGGEKVPRKPVVEISKEGLKALIDQGLKEKEIAAKLNCSISTVKRLKAVKGLVGYKPGETAPKPELPVEVDEETREQVVSIRARDFDEVDKKAVKETVGEQLKQAAEELKYQFEQTARDQVVSCQHCKNLGAKVALDEDGNCPVCCRKVEAAIWGRSPIEPLLPLQAENPDYRYPSSELEKAMTAVDRAQRTTHSYSAVDRAEVIAEILHGIADSLERTHGRRVEVDVVVLEVGE